MSDQLYRIPFAAGKLEIKLKWDFSLWLAN